MLIKVNKAIGNINVSFTPAFYKRAYTNYKNGDFKDLLALIERAEIDSFISGCLTARHAGYKRSYEIKPISDEKKDKDVALFVKQTFDNIYMREFFEDMIDARMKYYSVIALEWDVVEGKQVPIYTEKFEQKYFKYDPKDNYLKIDFGKTLEDIPADGAFVLESSRKPIMLTVLKDYIRKEFGEESWTSFLETFGEAFIIGKYPPGASAEQRTETEEGVNKIAMSTRGIVPEGTEIELIETKRSAGDHKDYKQDCNEGISMALLGHKDAAGSDKEMQIGDNQSGIQVKKDIAIDDMYWIQEKIRPFIKMIVDRNFSVAKYPPLIFDMSDKVDIRTKLTAAEIGLGAGAEIDAKFLIELGIPVTNTDQPLKQNDLLKQIGNLGG